MADLTKHEWASLKKALERRKKIASEPSLIESSHHGIVVYWGELEYVLTALEAIASQEEMKIEITEEEIREIAKVITIAANSELHDAIDWEIMAKFLAKIDRNPPPALPLDRPNLNRL